MATLEAQSILEKGVTVSWLSEHFEISPNTVRSKLQTCPHMGKIGKGFSYSLKEAARYLVTPNVDWPRLLRNLKKADLPPALQKDLWDARLKEQRFRIEAKELWETEDVIEAFTDVFIAIKSNVQLWPDVVERQIGLTDEQRASLVDLGDNLLDQIHTSIKERLSGRSTLAAIKDLDDLGDSPI